MQLQCVSVCVCFSFACALSWVHLSLTRLQRGRVQCGGCEAHHAVTPPHPPLSTPKQHASAPPLLHPPSLQQSKRFWRESDAATGSARTPSSSTTCSTNTPSQPATPSPSKPSTPTQPSLPFSPHFPKRARRSRSPLTSPPPRCHKNTSRADSWL